MKNQFAPITIAAALFGTFAAFPSALAEEAGTRTTDVDQRTAPGNTGQYTGGTGVATDPAGTTAGTGDAARTGDMSTTTGTVNADSTTTSMSSSDRANDAAVADAENRPSALMILGIIAVFAVIVAFVVRNYRHRHAAT